MDRSPYGSIVDEEYEQEVDSVCRLIEEQNAEAAPESSGIDLVVFGASEHFSEVSLAAAPEDVSAAASAVVPEDVSAAASAVVSEDVSEDVSAPPEVAPAAVLRSAPVLQQVPPKQSGKPFLSWVYSLFQSQTKK